MSNSSGCMRITLQQMDSLGTRILKIGLTNIFVYSNAVIV